MSFHALSDIIIISGIILFVAYGADKVLAYPRLDAWRRSLLDLWQDIAVSPSAPLLSRVNDTWLGLFDSIYGPSAFGRQRVIASAVLTTSALVVLTLILGYSKSPWPLLLRVTGLFAGEYVDIILVPLIVLMFNYIPDWFSVGLSRIVIKESRGGSAARLLSLVVLGILLSSGAFLSGVAAFLMVLYVVPGSGSVFPIHVTDLLLFIIRPEGGLLFALTALIPSLAWLSYLLFYGAVKLSIQFRPSVVWYYKNVVLSGQPVLSLAYLVVASILTVQLFVFVVAIAL